MQLSTAQIERILQTIIVPYLEEDLITAKVVKQIDVLQDKVFLKLHFHFSPVGFQDALIQKIKNQIANIAIDITWDVESYAIEKGLKTLSNVKNIIAVASGKGGVGKSTTAVNLALALAADGAQVGILDADIYGPNQPKMLGTDKQQVSGGEKQLNPIINHGIQSMSIGYLIEQDDTPVVWRGPMVTTALLQLLNDTQWQNLDYLIIDLPPGTGDIQLTLAQKIPVTAAVVVTTPQDIALLDVKKAIRMFEKVRIPVLGIIENMAVHVCSQCGHHEHIFGMGGGQEIATQYHTELLGQLPLNIKIRENADNGKPIVVADPTNGISEIYKNIARRMAAKLSLQQKNYRAKFPEIVIEK
jgi:ATP-binding protein involved in chromosome partitioning